MLSRELSKTICSGPPRRPEAKYSYPNDINPTLVWDVIYADESGWTVPWAMWRDDDDNYWLNIDQPLRDRSGGTVTLFVTSDGKGSVKVEVPHDVASRYWESENHKNYDTSIKVSKVKFRKDWSYV